MYVCKWALFNLNISLYCYLYSPSKSGRRNKTEGKNENGVNKLFSEENVCILTEGVIKIFRHVAGDRCQVCIVRIVNL